MSGACKADSVLRLMQGIVSCEASRLSTRRCFVLMSGGYRSADRALFSQLPGVRFIWERRALPWWLRPLSIIVADRAFLLELTSLDSLVNNFVDLSQGNAVELFLCSDSFGERLVNLLNYYPHWTDPYYRITDDASFLYYRYDEDLPNEFQFGGQWLACGTESSVCIQNLVAQHASDDELRSCGTP